MASSDFRGFLAERKSVRAYQDVPLSGEEVEYIVTCAGKAPSAGNREAWDVIVVADKETRWALAQAALDQPHVEQAPVLFVVCANYIRSMSKYGERGILYAVQDATIACTYMMLAAHAQGLASCWTGAFDESEVKDIFELPQHVRPIAILTVGRKSDSAQEQTGRMPIEEHVHQEYW
ncbi:MAG: nitroreductase family protein [Methanoregulaceae archaeon]